MGRRASSKVGVHGHGCIQCGCRYEDTCSTVVEGPRGGRKLAPGPDRLCITCRTGKPQPFWPAARLPQDCCRANSRVVRTEERDQYRLAGHRTWHICLTCSRTHPFDPAKKETR